RRAKHEKSQESVIVRCGVERTFLPSSLFQSTPILRSCPISGHYLFRIIPIKPNKNLISRSLQSGSGQSEKAKKRKSEPGELDDPQIQRRVQIAISTFSFVRTPVNSGEYGERFQNLLDRRQKKRWQTKLSPSAQLRKGL